MNKKTYSDSMQMLQFSADFDKKTIEKMEIVARKSEYGPYDVSEKKRFKWQYIAFPALACAFAAAAIFLLPMLSRPEVSSVTTVDTSAESSESETTLDEGTTVSEVITVIDAKKYKDSGMDSMVAPEPGEVRFDEGVLCAINDPETEKAYFFVELFFLTDMSTTELGIIEDYAYAGRPIAEWRVLVDLANETYPYNEYNGDFGGNISTAEFEAAIEEAKTLNAEANLTAAIEEYNAAYNALYPDPEVLRTDALAVECSRLQMLGYDVRLYETWTYFDDGQKKNHTILAGLFTKDELIKLRDTDVDPQIAVIVSWVRNGDGIETWNASKWDR